MLCFDFTLFLLSTVIQAITSCLSERKPPPPLIRTSSGESHAGRDSADDGDERRNKGGAKGTKRTKYKTEEERVAKEKERRNANNQRERCALINIIVITFTLLHVFSIKDSCERY